MTYRIVPHVSLSVNKCKYNKEKKYTAGNQKTQLQQYANVSSCISLATAEDWHMLM